jgi:hypothetical protein
MSNAELSRMLLALTGIGREQGIESSRPDCDLSKLGALIEQGARLRRQIIEGVEDRLAKSIDAGRRIKFGISVLKRAAGSE